MNPFSPGLGTSSWQHGNRLNVQTKPNACQATRGLGEGCLPYSAQDRLSQATLPSLEQGATSQGPFLGQGACLWACGQEAHLGESLCQAPRTVRAGG